MARASTTWNHHRPVIAGDAILELWIVLSFWWSLKSRTEAYRQSSLLEKAL
jgi:hypothetical protein